MPALLAQANALCADADFRLAILRHGAQLDGVDVARLVTRIHPDDQMLRHSLQHHGDANAAFAQYYNVALQQYHAARQVLQALFPGRADRIDLLDFACGYGRLLRFLSLVMPAERLFASEIQADALDFVRGQFGVQAIASFGEPARFVPGRRFDAIWVASLFSHLPAGLFDAWLARLGECLGPDGALCFSVHDAALVPPEHTMPPEGLLFFPVSENAGLEPSLYGTTYVTEAYVRAAVARACGPGWGCVRIPRALAHEQDLYVVAAPGRDLSALSGFRHGAWGWVDERRVEDDGTIHLRGWAASLDEGALDAVQVSLDGVMHRCPTGGLRDDVGRFFADPRLDRAGWTFRHRPPPGRDPVKVVVTARTPADERALLYAGPMPRPARADRGFWSRIAGVFAGPRA